MNTPRLSAATRSAGWSFGPLLLGASVALTIARPPAGPAAEPHSACQTGATAQQCAGVTPPIQGSGNRSSIGTLIERTTRFLILVHLPTAQPTAQAMRDGITAGFGVLPPHLRRTLTWDQGKELALHHQITASIGTRVFFCDAHSPWQRGSNENVNGLLRDYFPKGTDLSVISPEELRRVADEINDRPRKSLGWARPAELFNAAFGMTSVGREATA